jgi:hypothetical protein
MKQLLRQKSRYVMILSVKFAVLTVFVSASLDLKLAIPMLCDVVTSAMCIACVLPCA